DDDRGRGHRVQRRAEGGCEGQGQREGAEAEKKEQQMAQMKLKMSSARTKISIRTILPFLAVYYGLAALMGGLSVTVAYSPVPLCIPSTLICAVGQNGAVSLFWWYFMSSLTFTGMLTRLLGTAT